MKRLAYIILLIITVKISACNRGEVELLYDKPIDERIADTLKFIKSTLVGSEYGWIGYTSTNSTGGYGFYIDFKENDRLLMVADILSTTASEPKEATYRIRQIMAATLSFDTYSYITLLQDPNPGTIGGTAGKGLESDIEFEYKGIKADTIIFTGRRFKKYLKLVKATREQKDRYLNGEYKTAIDRINQFFADNLNSYVEIDGRKYQISMDNSLKNSEATTLLEGNEVVSERTIYYYDIDGVQFPEGLKVGNETLYYLRWENNDLYALNRSGNKYLVQNSPQPLMALHILMGKKYTTLFSPHLTILGGTSSSGETILRRYHNGLASGAAGYIFNCGYVYLQWNVVNQRIIVNGFSSQNGCSSGWTTTYTYSYELDSATGVYSLTKISGPTGGYVSAIMDQLINFLDNSSFRLDYHVEGTNVYGKIIGIDKSDVEMSFELL